MRTSLMVINLGKAHGPRAAEVYSHPKLIAGMGVEHRMAIPGPCPGLVIRIGPPGPSQSVARSLVGISGQTPGDTGENSQRFDADDLRSIVRQEHAGERSGPDHREVQDPKALQRQLGHHMLSITGSQRQVLSAERSVFAFPQHSTLIPQHLSSK